MRISDWSSDVCSSDLKAVQQGFDRSHPRLRQWSYRVRSAARMATPRQASELVRHDARAAARLRRVHEHGLWTRTRPADHADRKSVVEGKSVAVRVVISGSRIMTKNKNKQTKKI